MHIFLIRSGWVSKIHCLIVHRGAFVYTLWNNMSLLLPSHQPEEFWISRCLFPHCIIFIKRTQTDIKNSEEELLISWMWRRKTRCFYFSQQAGVKKPSSRSENNKKHICCCYSPVWEPQNLTKNHSLTNCKSNHCTTSSTCLQSL